MAISKIESEDLSLWLDRLLEVVDFDKDLPMNVFSSDNYLFWFFERPLLYCLEALSGLIASSVFEFKSDVFIKFSGAEPLNNSCFSLDGINLEEDILWLGRKFDSFFDGTVGYPIVVCDNAYRWIAFESASEEFGVIALKKSEVEQDFCEYLNRNFISAIELAELASSSSVEGKIARALISSYLV